MKFTLIKIENLTAWHLEQIFADILSCALARVTRD